ncbi:sulfide/dihydroorotate dehydrogenase-like FAD/NAD-binding protein [archaeon]|nr:MAG: sulfide/dihydroorotate dehydrogenase-like FAD/NAD-binding protein [archaeon]
MSHRGKCTAPFSNTPPYRIVEKRAMTPNVKMLEVEAEAVSKRGKPGQFVIVRVNERGERIPMTLGGTHPDEGTLTLYVAEVGASSQELGALRVGDSILNLSGPLGNPTEVRGYGDVLCVANGVFVGAHLFLVKALREEGNRVVSVIGARTTDQLFMVDEVREASDEALVAEDGEGFELLRGLLAERRFDHVFTIGSTSMQRFVSDLTRPSGTPTTVSLFPIMVDGTGMCGACRVTVGGHTRFACVNGPDFDGHSVDFDELVSRMRYYTPQEKIAMVLRERGVS